jgi:hypothetical protein
MAAKTAGRRPRRSAEFWRGLIEEWRTSGLDLAQFCRERQIRPTSLRWWRWRLGVSVERSASKAAHGGRRSASSKGDWIQLEIEERSAGTAPFELRWPNGMVLSIPADFDAGALGRLLAQLESSAC